MYASIYCMCRDMVKTRPEQDLPPPLDLAAKPAKLSKREESATQRIPDASKGECWGCNWQYVVVSSPHPTTMTHHYDSTMTPR